MHFSFLFIPIFVEQWNFSLFSLRAKKTNNNKREIVSYSAAKCVCVWGIISGLRKRSFVRNVVTNTKKKKQNKNALNENLCWKACQTTALFFFCCSVYFVLFTHCVALVVGIEIRRSGGLSSSHSTIDVRVVANSSCHRVVTLWILLLCSIHHCHFLCARICQLLLCGGACCLADQSSDSTKRSKSLVSISYFAWEWAIPDCRGHWALDISILPANKPINSYAPQHIES